MATITNILGTDKIKDSRAVINTNFDNLNTDKVETLADLGLTEPASAYNAVAISSALVPTGAISLWATSTAPTGYRICNGDEISRSTFADLFAVIGTTYGAGNGSTTFNLPNLKGRVPVGFDSAQTEFDALGETGGAKTHTLTEAQMPAHSHGVANNTIFRSNQTGTGENRFSTTTPTNSQDYTFVSQGDDQPHNNLQPYITLNYIIKT
jgi:microcystin-dependent protein